MRRNTKRFVAVAAPLAVAGIAGIAYAASITLTSNSLGSGDATVAACNNAASVSYGTAFSGASNSYEVNALNISSAAACATLPYKATLTGTGATLPVEVTGTLNASGGASPAVAGGVKASDVTGVHVVIGG